VRASDLLAIGATDATSGIKVTTRQELSTLADEDTNGSRSGSGGGGGLSLSWEWYRGFCRLLGRHGWLESGKRTVAKKPTCVTPVLSSHPILSCLVSSDTVIAVMTFVLLLSASFHAKCRKSKRKKPRGRKRDLDARDSTMGDEGDDTEAALTKQESVMWVGKRGRRLVIAAAAQSGAAAGAAAGGASLDAASDGCSVGAGSSLAGDAGGRPPPRLTFAERRALDLEQQELERGLLLWPDADMVEQQRLSQLGRPSRAAGHSSGSGGGAGGGGGGFDWRAKRAEAMQRKAGRISSP
jgi:hypothetical protein